MTTKTETAAYCDRQAAALLAEPNCTHLAVKWQERAEELRKEPQRRSVVGFLCFAYGESDIGAARLVETLEEVTQFFCEEWFGEPLASMDSDTREECERAMAEVRHEVGETERDGCWETTFEIGGIWVRRATFWKESGNG